MEPSPDSIDRMNIVITVCPHDLYYWGIVIDAKKNTAVVWHRCGICGDMFRSIPAENKRADRGRDDE